MVPGFLARGNTSVRLGVPSGMKSVHLVVSLVLAGLVAFLGGDPRAVAAGDNPPGADAAARGEPYERWSVVLMEGKRAGHLVVTEELGGDKGHPDLIRTRTTMRRYSSPIRPSLGSSSKRSQADRVASYFAGVSQKSSPSTAEWTSRAIISGATRVKPASRAG